MYCFSNNLSQVSLSIQNQQAYLVLVSESEDRSYKTFAANTYVVRN